MSDNTPSSPTTPQANAAPGVPRWPLILFGLVVVMLILGGLLLRYVILAPQPGVVQPLQPPLANARERDLLHPDALIESVSLSRLPGELLQVPLLRDTLTEDFVFYYENNADRLGLAGSLRRIVYEHDLTLQDSLIEELLDQPAQVALWRGADGRLSDFLVVMKRGGLAKLLEPLAHIATDDSQLRKVGDIKVGSSSTGIYRLRYNAQKFMLFASRGDYLVLLSNPHMLFTQAKDDDLGEPDKAFASQLATLLAGDDVLPGAFGLGPRGELSQRVSLGAGALAMGYQKFIPAFGGVRFDKDAKGWSSYLALNPVEGQPDLDFSSVWKAMPMGASACVALPVTPGLYDKLLVRLGADRKMAEAFSGHLSGAAGLCWYADSRLYTPLLVATFSAPPSPELDADLGKLFGNLVGAYEANAEGGSFPVEEENSGDTRKWLRQVSSRFGQYPANQAENPDAVGGGAFFRVGMARQGSTLLFSLDDRLLDKGMGALAKRFPPLADVLPKDALVPAYLAPQSLSALLQQETLDSLPQDMEPVFRNAADSLLLPRLKTFAGFGGYALGLPAGSRAEHPWQWLPLQWRAL
ncbi:DUF2138 domain-containing protein [Pseudomonas sp. QL9]|uniref:DUF2138 domain-containing protein n=1 Tax=Pseudomonas sp. QL9 TaxID=3242725 RepID=UPI003529F14F